jgi:hypothetical protein
MPVIELAYEGHVEKLKACYGSSETPPAEQQAPMPAQKAMSIFRLIAKRK